LVCHSLATNLELHQNPIRGKGSLMNSVVPFGTPFPMRQKMAMVQSQINGLTKKLGDATIKHVHANFRAQGFIDDSVRSWPQRKGESNKKAGLVLGGKPMLVKSGKLLSSIRILSLSPNRVAIGSMVPYSGVHNRTVGEMKSYHGANYPGRKFLGHSKALRDLHIAIIVTDVSWGLRKR